MISTGATMRNGVSIHYHPPITTNPLPAPPSPPPSALGPCFELFEDGQPVVFYDECQQGRGAPSGCDRRGGGTRSRPPDCDTCASVLVLVTEETEASSARVASRAPESLISVDFSHYYFFDPVHMIVV